MVLLTHQRENGRFASSEFSRTGHSNVFGNKTLRWSFRRKQLDTIQEQKPDYYFKLLLLGDCGTGKTSLANKFSCDACSKANYVQKPAVGDVKTVEYVDRVIEVSDKHILARLYDTAGQEKYRSLTASYYRGAHGCLVLFDVTKDSTFSNISYWLHDIKEYSTHPDIPTLLVGTKCHVAPEKREVSFERASKYAESVELPYLEVSIEENESVVPVIEKLLELVLEKINNHQTLNTQQANRIILQEQQKPTNNMCSC
ncbi:uncharacterized protein LOC123534336 [Mercenaria mercenaria]|uniref:uncharacterized protein LOC123534336 n=1 Tax=Mercenaria mercenaria TaxID=6596 RepID=UPI00234F2709|nr:uncharacterized protein LOC123534336 [Mercenaria mercenaria]